MAANVHLADFLAEYVAPYVTETEALEIALELGGIATLRYGNYDPEDLTAPIGWASGGRDPRSETLPGLVAERSCEPGFRLTANPRSPRSSPTDGDGC